MIPDLAGYDVIVLNTSGGKDSQVMIDEVYHLAVSAGVVDRLVAVHADLGKTPEGRDIEWPGTPELAEDQARHYGIRFVKVERQQNDLLSHVLDHGMWPSSTTRYCTSDHKRGPIRTVLTALAREQKDRAAGRRVRMLNCMGFRSQESTARAKRVPFVENGPASNKTVRQVDEWLPVHTWSIEQVWERIHATGVPYHPVYDLGMPRLSCSFCVLASRPALVRAAQLRPDLADEYRRAEVTIDHTFTHAFSMADLIAEAATRETPVTIPDWNA